MSKDTARRKIPRFRRCFTLNSFLAIFEPATLCCNPAPFLLYFYQHKAGLLPCQENNEKYFMVFISLIKDPPFASQGFQEMRIHGVQFRKKERPCAVQRVFFMDGVALLGDRGGFSLTGRGNFFLQMSRT